MQHFDRCVLLRDGKQVGNALPEFPDMCFNASTDRVELVPVTNNIFSSTMLVLRNRFLIAQSFFVINW